MEPSEQKRRASSLLVILALGVGVLGGIFQAPSVSADVVRAIYFSTATLLIGMALVIWAFT